MNKNILGTISICKKASKLIAGADVVYDCLENNKARLILVSNDCSSKTLKPIAQQATDRGVAIMTVPYTKEELGKACSRASCAIIAITDIGLANSIGKNLANTSKENEQIASVLDLKLKRKLEREERKGDPAFERVKKPKVEYNKEKGVDLKNSKMYKKNFKSDYKEPADKETAE